MATVKALHIAIGARVEGFQRGMEKAKRELRSFEKSTRRARGMVVGATGAMARGFAAMGAAATIAIADSVRVFLHQPLCRILRPFDQPKFPLQ